MDCFASLAMTVMPALARVRPTLSGLLRCLNPFRSAAPQRVAVLGAEKAEMADAGHRGLGGRDGQDFRPGRSKSRAKKLDGRSGRPRIVGKAQRAHCPAVRRKILERLELGIVGQL